MTNNWSSRAAATTFATLATVTPDGNPHLVPIVHAVIGDVVVFAVDHKPKSGRRLARLRHIESEPRVAVLFDERPDDWAALWWVRADGVATIHAQRPAQADVLEDRHRQYRQNPPGGPWVTIAVERWSGWSAEPDPRQV
ncbi:MAG: TIGR03668 family PPOX class F420-dependent oxidoreductase [Acidimicrobiia bacterium]